MSQKPQNEQCGSGCGTVATERNRYFTGKYMTARDFAGEQHYFLSRQRLHNRLLHGWGIVCGLRVLHHPREDQEECGERWVVVKAGVAIDCCGREIFVPEDIALKVPIEELPEGEDYEEEEPQDYDEGYEEKYPEDYEKEREKEYEKEDEYDSERYEKYAKRGYEREGHRDRGRRRHRPGHSGRPHPERPGHTDDGPELDWPQNGLLLCLYYDEEEIEPVPALYAEGQCDPQHHEPNRVREVARFGFRRLDEMEPGCWRMPNGWYGDEPCQDDCDQTLPGPSGGCLEPDCPCNACVPLALLFERDLDLDVDPSVPPPYAPLFDIDLRGRRQLRPPPHYMTHVIGINWPHGGEVSLQTLREEMDGELKIYFDRRLLPSEGDTTGTGINRRTFTVEYGGIQRGLEFLPSRENKEPGLEDDGCTAVFPIAPPFMRGRDNISDSFVYVTLRCDFILDCHEMPVDGNHLSGRLPTGDGIPGGEFVSWFRVVHDHHHEDEEME